MGSLVDVLRWVKRPVRRGADRLPERTVVIDDLVSHLVDARDASFARHESLDAFRHASARALARRPATGFCGSILWVDDHPETIEPLLAALRRLGINVDWVSSTKEAIDAVYTTVYSGIVSDMRREEGGVDHPFAGIELARALEPSSTRRPMLVFTGPRGMQHEDELRDAGVHAVSSRATELLGHVTTWTSTAGPTRRRRG